MPTLHKPLVVALALVLALGSFLIIARPVAAAQNRPTWTQGDFWVYTRTEGSATSTIRLDVYERTTLSFALGSYSVWHITQTTSDSGGSSIVHIWVQDTNLGIAKTNTTVPGFGEVGVTFDPPVAQAVFPLTVGAQWSLSSTMTIVNTTFSFPFPYSGTVTAEQSTAVAAGSFNVAIVRSPATGPERTENHYSDGAGNSVKEEEYDSSGNRVAMQELTSYRYQAGTFGLLLILVIVALIAATAIAAIVVLRRRRRTGMPPPGMAPPMPPTEPPMGP